MAKTISGGIINPSEFKDENIFALCMPAVIAGSAFAVCCVTFYGIPISITQGVLFGKPKFFSNIVIIKFIFL